MLNDFTGGPVLPLIDAVKFSLLSVSVGLLSFRLWRSKAKVRRRLNIKAPNVRLHIDGIATYA